MESLDETAMVCLRGESLTHHTSQMKLFNAIAAAAVIGTSLITATPAEARNGWVYVTSTQTETGVDASNYVKVTSRSGNVVYLISRWSDMGDFNKQVNCSSWRHRTDSRAWRDIMPGSIAETMAQKVC